MEYSKLFLRCGCRMAMGPPTGKFSCPAPASWWATLPNSLRAGQQFTFIRSCAQPRRGRTAGVGLRLLRKGGKDGRSSWSWGDLQKECWEPPRVSVIGRGQWASDTKKFPWYVVHRLCGLCVCYHHAPAWCIHRTDPTRGLPSRKGFFFTGWIYNFVVTGRRRTLGTGNTILLKIWSCTNSSLEHKTKWIYT